MSETERTTPAPEGATTRDQIMVELRAYHAAVMELGADIAALRRRVTKLEQERGL